MTTPDETSVVIPGFPRVPIDYPMPGCDDTEPVED